MRRKDPEAEHFWKATFVIVFVSVNELCVHISKKSSMWNNTRHSQLRLGSWNWLDSRWGEHIRKRNTFLKATLVILFVSVNELCVHVPKEFSMWNNIQPSQLRLGSWYWLDFRWCEKVRKRNTFLKATLVILFVSINELCVHVPKESSMWNNTQHSQLRLGPWDWLGLRWGGKILKQKAFWKSS